MKKKNKNGYFHEAQQEALILYLRTDDTDLKNHLFMTYLKEPLTIMVESIIRRYNLYIPDETFEETFSDVLSFLLTKLDNFTIEKGRAYSYLQTICKNYLLYKINKYKTNVNRNTPLEKLYTVYDKDESDAYYNGYDIAEEERPYIKYNQLIEGMLDGINNIFNEHESGKIKLNANEKNVGECLYDIISNWEYIYDEVKCDKFNKNSVLTFIKIKTGLDTKEIRDAMKIYKKKYYNTKNILLCHVL